MGLGTRTCPACRLAGPSPVAPAGRSLPVPNTRTKWPTCCCCAGRLEGAGIGLSKRRKKAEKGENWLCFAFPGITGRRGGIQPSWHLLVPAGVKDRVPSPEEHEGLRMLPFPSKVPRSLREPPPPSSSLGHSLIETASAPASLLSPNEIITPQATLIILSAQPLSSAGEEPPVSAPQHPGCGFGVPWGDAHPVWAPKPQTPAAKYTQKGGCAAEMPPPAPWLLSPQNATHAWGAG